MLEDFFEDIIGKARYGRNMSVFELACKSGLSEKRVTELEGGSLPKKNEILLIAETLGLSSEKLTLIVENKWTSAPKAPYCGKADIYMVQIIDGHIGAYAVNGYLFVDWQTRECVLFDTGCDPRRVLQFLTANQVRLVGIFVTHAHPDHIGGIESIQVKSGAPLYSHPDEKMPFLENRQKPVHLKDGAVFQVGRFQIKTHHTPGHTNGGMTYTILSGPNLVNPLAFVGDALFAGSLGRAQSSKTYLTLIQSVREKILSLPVKTQLFPGHGPVTSVAEERQHNPFFTQFW